jgi:hypothetical protein
MHGGPTHFNGERALDGAARVTRRFDHDVPGFRALTAGLYLR